MLRTTSLVLLLLSLPSCVAAIGNTGGTLGEMPTSVLPLMRERVEAANRIVALRRQKADDLKAQVQAGRGEKAAVADAEIALEEATIRLLEYKAQVQAMESRLRDDD